MGKTRRNWLRATAVALASVGLAGCGMNSDDGDDENSDDEGEENGGDSPTRTETESSDQQSNGENSSKSEEGSDSEGDLQADAVDIGVASEWNAVRTRLRDPVILGHAEEYAAGASVVGDIFERFESASGENNAHEMLEETSEENYEGFEGALGELRETLESEDLDGAHETMRSADRHLRQAQGALTNDETVGKLTLLVMGAHVEDAVLLLKAGDREDAAMEFSHIATKFEEKGLHGMVAESDQEAADEFVDALGRASEAAESDSTAATEAAHEAFAAASQGLHAIAGDDLAGAAHVAALQGRGWDAAALAGLGGPPTSYAHAAALNTYRARARDAGWLYESGNEEAARALIQRGVEQFETARAHDPLEEAAHDTYETFEGGLESLMQAIQDDDDGAVNNAVEAVETAVRDGIGALVSGSEQALLEAGDMKSRIEDAHERYRLDDADRAAEIAQDVFADFEADAGGFHETLEETDEDLYERFEHDHLEGLIEAFESGDDEAVVTHVAGIRETLLSFETAAGSTAAVSGVESAYIASRVLDALVLDHLGKSERGSAVVTEAFQHFESGAGGFHEAIEGADHDTYESFEDSLTTVGDGVGERPVESVETVVGRSTEATYAIVAGSSGGGTGASSIASDTFAHFEESAVHEPLEEADHDAYESFEGALEEYISALDSGSGVQDAAAQFADASLRAQFAVAGAPDGAPVDSTGQQDDESGETLQGGPNVVDGVPDDADHVVDMAPVSFDPAELAVSQGDTVAWTHAGGEPHSVTAYEERIPEDATYWASGDFESEKAARNGWEEGEGAVQSGESYVHTFETTGTHEYVCVPHEAAGMVGTVVVE